MDLFVTKQVFNEYLEGKAVHIHGHDADGDLWGSTYLVKEAGGDFLLLTTSTGTEKILHKENFEKDLLTLEILEVK